MYTCSFEVIAIKRAFASKEANALFITMVSKKASTEMWKGKNNKGVNRNEMGWHMITPQILIHQHLCKNCKQAIAKVRAHISGPWFWLQSVCLQHYTVFKNISKNWFYSQWCRWHFQVAILYPCIQWVKCCRMFFRLDPLPSPPVSTVCVTTWRHLGLVLLCPWIP